MMLWKIYLLSTMAILGSYVRFQGCKFSIGKQLMDFRFARGPTSQLDADKEEEAEEVPPPHFSIKRLTGETAGFQIREALFGCCFPAEIQLSNEK